MPRPSVLETHYDIVLQHCEDPVKVKDLVRDIGISDPSVRKVLKRLVTEGKVDKYGKYYFHSSEENLMKASFLSLRPAAKQLYNIIAVSPKTVEQLYETGGLSEKNIYAMLSQLRVRELLVEDYVDGSARTRRDKVYSAKHIYGLEAEDGDAAEAAYEEPEEPRKRAPIDREMPKGSDDELWIGKGDNYRTWLDNNLGYGAGFTSRELLEALLEQDIRVADLGSHKVYMRSANRDNMLGFLHDRRVIKVYIK